MTHKKTIRIASPSKRFPIDFSAWNFVMFLTLALILLVVVLIQMKTVSLDIRTKAGLECPKLIAPRAEDCTGGWTYKRDTNGCVAFFCEN